MAFRTESVSVSVTTDDRIVRVYRTTCTDCGAVAKDRADRRAHSCKAKP